MTSEEGYVFVCLSAISTVGVGMLKMALFYMLIPCVPRIVKISYQAPSKLARWQLKMVPLLVNVGGAAAIWWSNVEMWEPRN